MGTTDPPPDTTTTAETAAPPTLIDVVIDTGDGDSVAWAINPASIVAIRPDRTLSEISWAMLPGGREVLVRMPFADLRARVTGSGSPPRP